MSDALDFTNCYFALLAEISLFKSLWATISIEVNLHKKYERIIFPFYFIT